MCHVAVSIPRALNPKTGMPESGFKVANAIRDFLAKKGVLEKGASRERFKLYFRPKAQSTPDQVLRDLERGGFVCVAAMTRFLPRPGPPGSCSGL